MISQYQQQHYECRYYGWCDALANDIDIHKLTISPAGMLVEPFVTELANKLTDWQNPIKSTPDSLCVYPILQK